MKHWSDKRSTGLRNTQLLNGDKILSTWSYRAKYGYPTPALDRDKALAQILPAFEAEQYLFAWAIRGLEV